MAGDLTGEQRRSGPIEVQVTWLGPYVFVPRPGYDCVFDRDETGSPGLSLWTVVVGDGFLVNDVGETGRDLWSRLAENVAHSFGDREGVVSDPVDSTS